MVRILSSVNHWACIFWILSMQHLLLLSGSHLWSLSTLSLLLLSGSHLWLLSILCLLLHQVCMLCLLPGLYFLVTTGIVSPGYQLSCISWCCWDCIFWLPLELPLLVTTKVTSFVDNLTVLPGVRAVKSPTQSGHGALRSAEFRLQRKGEARDSSDPSFP